MPAKILPAHANLTWRALQPSDAPALLELLNACARLDGATRIPNLADCQRQLRSSRRLSTDSQAAFDQNGQLAAAGWNTYNESHSQVRAFLEGYVHPAYRRRGLGSALLHWQTARARQHFRAIAHQRKQILRIMFYDRADDAIQLYLRHGFSFLYSEDEMRYRLNRPLPPQQIPPGLRLSAWSPERAAGFYQVYRDAFSTRTQDLLAAADWRQQFADPADPEFQPSLSLLVSALFESGPIPIAYTVCHTQSDPVGAPLAQVWVTQIGVATAWRCRGVGSGLLAETLRRFKEHGYRQALLSVNVDNSQAIRLYERLGFKLVKRLTMYARDVTTLS